MENVLWGELLCVLAAGLWTFLPAQIYKAKHRTLLTTLWVTANWVFMASMLIEVVKNMGAIS